MFNSTAQPWFKKLIILMIFVMTSLILLPSAFADVKDYMNNLKDEVSWDYDALDERVKRMDPNNPRKKEAERLLDEARKAKNEFNDLDVDDHIMEDNQPSDVFLMSEEYAREKINAVKVYLLQPVHPGAEGIEEEGTVPTGDIIYDFIPQFIRLLMRFASLAVLVAFVVSGVMFVMAFGNEERLSRAKNILYYTLIGFAFVALAFAVVKAITDIDFFGFI